MVTGAKVELLATKEGLGRLKMFLTEGLESTGSGLGLVTRRNEVLPEVWNLFVLEGCGVVTSASDDVSVVAGLMVPTTMSGKEMRGLRKGFLGLNLLLTPEAGVDVLVTTGSVVVSGASVNTGTSVVEMALFRLKNNFLGFFVGDSTCWSLLSSSSTSFPSLLAPSFLTWLTEEETRMTVKGTGSSTSTSSTSLTLSSSSALDRVKEGLKAEVLILRGVSGRLLPPRLPKLNLGATVETE